MQKPSLRFQRLSDYLYNVYYVIYSNMSFLRISKQLQVNNINSPSNNVNVITPFLENKYLLSLSIMLQYQNRVFFLNKNQ